MKLRHWAPLLGFVLPTVIIGYGFVIPRSCIAGVNELTIGFATTVAGASLTYRMGVRAVLREFGALGRRQCAPKTRPAGPASGSRGDVDR